MKEDLLLDKKQKNHKAGKILFPTVIFIVLNIMIFGTLLIFVSRTFGGAVVYEQAYAKQIALIINEAKPVMEIKLNMEDGMKLAEKNNIDFDEIVKIENNAVIVKLSRTGGYSYSFFNDINITAYPDNEFYVFNINEKEK